MPRLTCVLAPYRALDACASSLLSRSASWTRRRARTGGDAAPDDVVLLRRFALRVLAGAAHWRQEAKGGNEATGGRWPGGR